MEQWEKCTRLNVNLCHIKNLHNQDAVILTDVAMLLYY